MELVSETRGLYRISPEIALVRSSMATFTQSITDADGNIVGDPIPALSKITNSASPELLCALLKHMIRTAPRALLPAPLASQLSEPRSTAETAAQIRARIAAFLSDSDVTSVYTSTSSHDDTTTTHTRSRMELDTLLLIVAHLYRVSLVSGNAMSVHGLSVVFAPVLVELAGFSAPNSTNSLSPSAPSTTASEGSLADIDARMLETRNAVTVVELLINAARDESFTRPFSDAYGDAPAAHLKPTAESPSRPAARRKGTKPEAVISPVLNTPPATFTQPDAKLMQLDQDSRIKDLVEQTVSRMMFSPVLSDEESENPEEFDSFDEKKAAVESATGSPHRQACLVISLTPRTPYQPTVERNSRTSFTKSRKSSRRASSNNESHAPRHSVKQIMAALESGKTSSATSVAPTPRDSSASGPGDARGTHQVLLDELSSRFRELREDSDDDDKGGDAAESPASAVAKSTAVLLPPLICRY